MAFVVLRRRAYYRQHQRLLNENNKEMKTKKRSLVDDSLLSWNTCRRQKSENLKEPHKIFSPNDCHEYYMMNVAITTILPLYYKKRKDNLHPKTIHQRIQYPPIFTITVL